MEHLYNPDQMSEQEIKGTFVARSALLDRLMGVIRSQPDGAGVRHVVLVAPRGMGKTTMLLMVQFAVADRGLAPPWLAIRFPEELYGVSDLADFWLETLAHVSVAAGDEALGRTAQDLKARYPDSATLQEAAPAALRDWCRRNGRRLLLLVDNFHQVLGLMDEQQAAALRRVLMSEGWLMLLGAAPSFFKEASNYDEPLYNFFQIERLERLTFAEMRSLLLQRATADGLADFEKTLDASTTRLRVLEYFTGGNARLVLMLYRIITRSDVSEMRRDLELLLDQVTPFYKAKTEDLPPQQRKILDHIARASGQTHEGVSPSEIAKAVRLTPQVVSAQLKRLTEQGYVHPANLRGRSAFYTLSEPLYSLWYQMRFGRDARQRMAWLVSFLKGFYTVQELGEQSHLLESRFQSLLAAGQEREARNALEYRRWIAEALPDRANAGKMMERIIHDYLVLRDFGTLKEQVLTDDQLKYFSHKTLAQLVANECITQEQATAAHNSDAADHADIINETILSEIASGTEAFQQQRFEDALGHFREASMIAPNTLAQVSEKVAPYALLLLLDDRQDDALKLIDIALASSADNWLAWVIRGSLLAMSRPDEALRCFDKALASVKAQSVQPIAAIYLARFSLKTKLGRITDAMHDWQAMLDSRTNWPSWISATSEVLLDMAQQGHSRLIRTIIAEAHIEDQLFPLARALDYLASGDAALIEKLTPEMRPIVEEVVTKLRPAPEADAAP